MVSIKKLGLKKVAHRQHWWIPLFFEWNTSILLFIKKNLVQAWEIEKIYSKKSLVPKNWWIMIVNVIDARLKTDPSKVLKFGRWLKLVFTNEKKISKLDSTQDLTTSLFCLYVVRTRTVCLNHFLNLLNTTQFFKCNFLLFDDRHVGIF